VGLLLARSDQMRAFSKPVVRNHLRRLQGEVFVEKRCPKCRLYNPPSALRCDCGYDFSTGSIKESYLTGMQRVAAAKPGTGEIIFCILLPLPGLIYALVLKLRGEEKSGRLATISAVTIVVAMILRFAVAALKAVR
jgi:hypothetical protein